MTCSQCQKLVHRALDLGQDPRGSTELAAHLSACPRCAEFVEEMRTVDAVLRTVAPERMRVGFQEGLYALEGPARPLARPVWQEGARILVPAVLAWAALSVAGGQMETLVHVLVPATGLAWFLIAVGKPRFIDAPCAAN